MTGDSSRRKQALSVFLSTLMVLSVLAMGMAGFAGSAAALENPKTDDSDRPISGAAGGFVVANPANPGDPTVHNASVQLATESNVVGQNSPGTLQNVTINYSQADVDFDIEDEGASNSGNLTAITLTVDGNSVTAGELAGGDGGDAAVEINNEQDTIVIDELNDTANGDFSSGVDINNGSKVFVEIDESALDSSATFANSEGADGQSTVTMELGGDETKNIESQDLTLELPGAVEAYTDQTDDSGSADSTFTTISDALASTAVDGGNKDFVSVGAGEYREFGNAIAVDEDNVTLSGSSAVLNVSGAELDVGSTATASGVTIDGFVFEGNDDASGAIIDTNGQQNTTITGNEFRNYSAVVVTLAPSDGNEDQITVSSNTFSEGIAQTAIDVDPSSLSDEADTVTVESNVITLESAGANAAIDISTGGGTGQVDIIDGSIEGDSTVNTDTGISTHNENITITGVSINATGTGIDAADNIGETLTITGVTIDNTANTAIDLSNDPTNSDATVTINASTSIDQASNGVVIDHNTGNVLTVDITNVVINGTTSGAVNFTEMDAGDDNNVFNITDSTFTNNNAGIGLGDITNDVGDNINVHFNTFESNTVGVEVDTSAAPNTYNGTLNLQFNDIVDSDSNGLNVNNIGPDGVVNANYSYWGAPTGPANGGSTQDAFGDGDSVTLSSSSDATVYPFLTEETGSLISDSQQSGSQLIVLPDPERPIGSANDDNTALVGVANLNGSVGASNPDLFAPSADSQPTAAQSFSGTLSPSNIAQFEVNLSSPGTIDVQGVADGASSNTVQQTYTGQSDSITFSANKSVVSTGSPSEITAQAVDSNGNPVERQGLNVRFAEDSGFSDANVELVSRDGNTSNSGTATAIVQDAGSLSPGQEFTVLANIDGNVERANFSTAAGEIDPGTSTLRLNDSTDDFGDLQVDSTVDVSAEILDANQNPLEGRTVEFASNGTVEFGSDSVDTNSDGFANTTVTVDTETQGVVAINATVGNFNTTSTSSAQRNITTIAGDATQLGFASDSRSMAPGASLDPTVQVQDEFGNFNDTASVNNGISVTSSDTNVISVSGVDDLSGNSDQFTLSAESGGEATITVSSDDSDISGVNDTFVVSDPAAIDLSVAHNVATVSANNSNANTQNQALVTAQFTDSDGSALGVANENISFGLSGSSAELNQSDVTTKSTDGDGNVTILVNGTDTTGTSTIVATAENFTSINRGETTVTTTGSASGISLSPENDTIAQNDEINVTAEFVDDEGRNVPRLTDVSLSADDGNVTTGTTATAPNDDGAVVSTFTYNSSGASESVTITATGGGLFGETTVTIEEQDQESASVTFNDQSVQNGTEEVTVASANYTLADGSEGDYVVVMHVVNDDGSISSPVGASSDQTGSASDITVDLNDTSAAFEDGDALDTLTENTTLRAMLHETSNDSAFGPSLGLATDDADITVTPESPIDGPAGDFDTDADGDISIGELGDAGEAFAQGELTIAELGAVGQQFAS